jgi:hypothetical protein
MAEALLSPPSSPRLNRSDSFELLCACSCSQPGPAQLLRIANWDYSEFDWEGLFHLAEHHGVLPLVACNLTNRACGVQSEVIQSLRSAYEENLRRNLWFAAELIRILDHFEQKGIRAIPYKGPMLAESAYGDLALRSFSDLDLLISAVDFEKAKKALAEIGYRPSQEQTEAVEQLLLKTGYERSFDGQAGKNLVELQWKLLPLFYAVDFASAGFGFDDLFARAKPLGICGRQLLCLSPEDSLLALCLHAAKHLWTRLVWVADIAESQHRQTIDFSLVIASAQRLGIARILAVSLWLAERLLGTTIPPASRLMVDDDPEAAKYGEQCVARMSAAATYDFESSEYFKQILKLRERPADRGRYLWRLVWTPGPGEVAAVTLPQTLFPLYRAIRIGRLSRRLVQAHPRSSLRKASGSRDT